MRYINMPMRKFENISPKGQRVISCQNLYIYIVYIFIELWWLTSKVPTDTWHWLYLLCYPSWSCLHTFLVWHPYIFYHFYWKRHYIYNNYIHYIINIRIILLVKALVQVLFGKYSMKDGVLKPQAALDSTSCCMRLWDNTPSAICSSTVGAEQRQVY